MREYETGATRSALGDKLQYRGFLSARVLTQFARYMHKHRVQEDGGLREPDNWKRGMPLEDYLDSLTRHVHEINEVTEGRDPADPEIRARVEETLCAVMFNVQGALFELTRPDP